jgi:hypothetical protein
MARTKAVGGLQFNVIALDDKQKNFPKINILYLDTTDPNVLKNWQKKLEGTPTLIVTEQEGFGKLGSMINFFEEDKKLKFEVNRSSIEKSGLKIASELVRFGKEI